MTQVKKSKKREDFMKKLKLVHKENNWSPLPRKTKCEYCKTYHHECSANQMGLGLKACHSCANVEEKKRAKLMKDRHVTQAEIDKLTKKRDDLHKRSIVSREIQSAGGDPCSIENVMKHAVPLKEYRALSKEIDALNKRIKKENK